MDTDTKSTFQFLIGNLITPDVISRVEQPVPFQFLIGNLITQTTEDKCSLWNRVSIPHR